MSESAERIARHYARSDLRPAILMALQAAGKDLRRLTPEDLAPIDEFHVRGREATLELAELAALDAKSRVLDLGCGLGGPTRVLASRCGCRVTGLDLTEAYCQAATLLAERVGLAHLVDYRQGDALATPFDDGAFDLVWTQHAAMNISDKAALYREAHRVVKPGGRVALYDVLQGPGGPPHYPVPWAREPSISFLVTPETLRDLLTGAGLEIVSWQDKTEAGRQWFRRLADRIRAQGLPPLGFHLLLGDDFAAMAENQRRNLDEGRIVLIQALCRRP